MPCKCQWNGPKIIALCDAHERAFRDRVRALMPTEFTPGQLRKVQAVKERLRDQEFPEPGDMLFDALGRPCARVTHVMLEHHSMEMGQGYPHMRQYASGLTDIKMEVQWVGLSLRHV